ncbi:MAG TPA: hypothetical protein VHZ54_17710 [Solirubrobacterales bacterium]|jgi:protocatechuate 3,4-dioxygenase beta subunit|nr:hypothetical protein [Solirubrobacterales bacterium]
METSRNEIDAGGTEGRRGRGLTRRGALGAAGFAGAALLVGGKLPGGGSVAQPDIAQAASCVVTGAVEEGPFFVDEGLDRSDTRTDTTTDTAQAGVPLTLTLTFIDTSDDCSPVVGAMIDVWNANAYGKYSDESSNGTLNEDWLRGYQVTDSNGQVTFTTIYPRWYSGRTEHFHIMVRTYSGSTQTYKWTTQLFFNEQINDEVLATSPYTASGRDKTNETDRLYTTANEVALTGSTSSGYTGAYTVGLSGLSSSTSSGSSSGSSGSGSTSSNSSSESGSKTGSSSSASDEAVGARLTKVTLRRPRGGRRSLRLRVVVTEAVDARIRLEREGKVLVTRTAAVKSGAHEVEVPIGNRVEAGPARVDVVFTDEAGNRKTVNHRIVLRGAR